MTRLRADQFARRFRLNRVLIAVVIVAMLPPVCRAGDKVVYRIGVPRSSFRDLPPGLIGFAGQPFKDLMKTQTGLDGEAVIMADSMMIAADIDSGKLQMGVFHGYEFAWAKQKYAELEPIVCSVPRPKNVQAFVLVRVDAKAVGMGDFRGKRLVMASTSRDCARLFLRKQESETLASKEFGSLEKAQTVHEAIHKVIEGDADLTVVDSASWNYYQKIYPGRSRNLRVLSRSEVFPPTVLAFKKGRLDESTLKAIRAGLLVADKNPKAVRIMNLIRIDRFETVPEHYDAAVKSCLKAYPSPLVDK